MALSVAKNMILLLFCRIFRDSIASAKKCSAVKYSDEVGRVTCAEGDRYGQIVWEGLPKWLFSLTLGIALVLGLVAGMGARVAWAVDSITEELQMNVGETKRITLADIQGVPRGALVETNSVSSNADYF
ncbi:MAG: hypothetical protein IKG22_01625 [Atopobiaceae bacterium]|nr:hypothetical protein [Atopobiaceae bacterium]